MNTLFANNVHLRGFLGANADVPTSEYIRNDSYAVLTLCVESGVWKIEANEWAPKTARIRVICPGPYFCGFTRGMKQGEYLDIEGELRFCAYDEPIEVSKEPPVLKMTGLEVHATRIERLDVPPVGVEIGEDG